METNMIKAIALLQNQGRNFYFCKDTAYTDEALTQEVAEYDDQDWNNDYLVLTDEEATDKTTDYIKDSLWAFNADFICSQIGLPWAAQEMVSSFCADKCEGANDTILAMIEQSADGLQGFVEAAIQADGRGHFMNSYDGNEDEETVTVDGEQHTFYIYRMN